MIICKSIIKIKDLKGEDLKTFEVVLNRNYVEDKIAHNVELIEVKDSVRSSTNVEDYLNEVYYKFLKKIVLEHLNYRPNIDNEYLIRMFREHKALDFIEIERDSEPFYFTKEIGSKYKIKAEITTYELNANIAIKNILDLERLVDLDDKSLSRGLNKYISKNVLKTLNQTLDIHSVNVIRYDNDSLELNRINNMNIGKVYIRDFFGSGFKFEERDGLKIAYIKGMCRGLGYDARIKDIDFFEFDEGSFMFFIIDRGDVSKTKIKELFGFDVVSFFGKVAVGIVTKREYTV